MYYIKIRHKWGLKIVRNDAIKICNFIRKLIVLLSQLSLKYMFLIVRQINCRVKKLFVWSIHIENVLLMFCDELLYMYLQLISIDYDKCKLTSCKLS